MKPAKLKSDRYRKARGGYARFLKIACEKCGSNIATYQKDGPGLLKRMYWDRIVEPDDIVGLEKRGFGNVSNFVCKKCGHLLGVPIIYAKENRPAFRLFAGAVKKTIVKNASTIYPQHTD